MDSKLDNVVGSMSPLLKMGIILWVCKEMHTELFKVKDHNVHNLLPNGLGKNTQT